VSARLRTPWSWCALLLCVAGCKERAAPAPAPAPPTPVVAVAAPLLTLTPAQKARLGVPCALLGDALVAYLEQHGRGAQAPVVWAWVADPRKPTTQFECDFALEDGEAQAELLAQVEKGKLTRFEHQALIDRRYGTPKSGQRRLDDEVCGKHREWNACVGDGCRVWSKCTARAAGGRCDPKWCRESGAAGWLQDPRASVCDDRGSGQGCAMFLEGALSEQGPVTWATIGGVKVGCAAHDQGTCAPVEDAAHPAGWRCERSGCSAWRESPGGSKPMGCRAASGGAPGRCVPFTIPGDAFVHCRDLEPPCRDCVQVFDRCVGVLQNPH
jgi:hypothetical protein